jgi:hypothetical protein
VSGALVRFAISKGRATFNGARTLSATTDALGRATATGFTPTGSGTLNIAASATFQGQTAVAAIAQTTVTTAAQAAAVSAGTGAGAAGGGGGLSNVAIAGIVGGAGAGIGGALLASKSSSDSDSSDSDRCAASPVCGRWDVLFNSPPGLDVSACGLNIPGSGFSSQGFNIDLNGVFHEVWSTATPVVQVDGTLTPAGLTATLRCLSTAATGTMSATPSGPDFLGTATLSGTTTSMRISRRPANLP